MPTIEQIRAARALLDWSQSDLANRADLSQTGIARIENGTNKPNSSTLAKIEAAFQKADVEFLGLNGVKKRTGEVRTLLGPNAMSDFLDDVFETILEHGSMDKPISIFLSNVAHENWVKCMGQDRWKQHTERMTKHKDIMDVRIIVKEGDNYFPASEYSQYKWIPRNLFNEKSFYSYHDKLAFLDFGDDGARILIMQQKDFARGYRDLFLIAWDYLAVSPT